jgi:hypothetical protein
MLTYTRLCNIYMPNTLFYKYMRFTDGNLIVLYTLFPKKPDDESIPGHIKERIKLCLNIFSMITQSKPDRHKTEILVIAKGNFIHEIKTELVKGGVEEKIIAVKHTPKNVSQTFDEVVKICRSRINPPQIYFVGSVWLRDIYDSVVVSRLRGYKVQFEGALDHRPVDEVERDRAADAPKKGMAYYKKSAKDKAVDIFLNRMFSEGR